MSPIQTFVEYPQTCLSETVNGRVFLVHNIISNIPCRYYNLQQMQAPCSLNCSTLP